MSKENIPANSTDRAHVIELFNSLNLNEKDRMQKSITTKPQTVDEIANKWKINNKIMTLFAEKIEQDTKLKSRYAIWLIVVLIVQLIALNTWFVLMGLNIIKIENSTFNIFITGGLAEVFILIRVIVKYLFNDNLSELLKLIIRTNSYKSSKNKNNKNT